MSSRSLCKSCIIKYFFYKTTTVYIHATLSQYCVIHGIHRNNNNHGKGIKGWKALNMKRNVLRLMICIGQQIVTKLLFTHERCTKYKIPNVRCFQVTENNSFQNICSEKRKWSASYLLSKCVYSNRYLMTRPATLPQATFEQISRERTTEEC